MWLRSLEWRLLKGFSTQTHSYPPKCRTNSVTIKKRNKLSPPCGNVPPASALAKLFAGHRSSQATAMIQSTHCGSCLSYTAPFHRAAPTCDRASFVRHTLQCAARQKPLIRGAKRRVRHKRGSLVAMAAEPQQTQGYVEEKLYFTNPQGERLVGLLVDTGSQDVVLLCHGYVANMSYCQFPKLAAGLAEAGVSSFRFDHACAIFSESERKGPFLMGNHTEEVQDMAAAVQFLRSRGRTVSCILGHSKGGINVLIYGAQHGDVPKLVDLSGRFSVRCGVLQRFGQDILDRLAQHPEGIERVESFGLKWTMTEQDFRNRADLDMEGYARAIPPSVQVLVLHGTGDETIPYQESEVAATFIPNAKLQLIEGADHNYRKPQHAQQMVEAVVEFVTS